MTLVDTSYPPPDPTVREYFTTRERGIKGRWGQAARYASFFSALFDMTLATLCPDVKTPGDLRQRFKIEHPERATFYQNVVEKASSNREKEKGLEVRIICDTRTPVD
jgi:hypothetical protein